MCGSYSRLGWFLYDVLACRMIWCYISVAQLINADFPCPAMSSDVWLWNLQKGAWLDVLYHGLGTVLYDTAKVGICTNNTRKTVSGCAFEIEMQ